jgi:hypothetical protein
MKGNPPPFCEAAQTFLEDEIVRLGEMEIG